MNTLPTWKNRVEYEQWIVRLRLGKLEQARVESICGPQVGNVTSRGMQAVLINGGATVISWPDRYAGTIIKITRCQIHVQQDKATRVGELVLGESHEPQSYTYERDPDGRIYVFRKAKHGYTCGTYGHVISQLVIGEREEYHDYSF